MALRRPGVRIPSAPYRLIPRSGRALASLILVALVALAVPMTIAQGRQAPRALVLVHAGDNQSLVSVTFSSKTDHGAVRKRLGLLAQELGARVVTMSVEDVDPSGGQADGRQKASVQTGGVLCVEGSPFVSGSAFRLQPFLAAMADLGSFEVLFMMPRMPAFTGLTRYNADGVDLRLLQDGDPYRYMVTVAQPVGRLPLLPLSQPPAPKAPPEPSSRRALREWSVLLAIAGASGIVAFVALLARARLRGSAA